MGEGSIADEAYDIALDSSGNAYVTGWTIVADFPTLNAYQSGCPSASGPNGCVAAFISKLDPAASGAESLLYSTYLGGSVGDGGDGIAVDSSGNAYVTGWSVLDRLSDPACLPDQAQRRAECLRGQTRVRRLPHLPRRRRRRPQCDSDADCDATKTATPSATPTPNGSASPPTLAFSSEVAGQTSATIKTVTVASRSKAPLIISSVTVAGTDGSATPEFSITGGTCGPSYPYTVSPSPAVAQSPSASRRAR